MRSVLCWCCAGAGYGFILCLVCIVDRAGAVLQSWSAIHLRTETDYLWSTGPTPFGPYSTSLHLSFAIVDAAARNMVLSALHQIGREVAALLEHFSVSIVVGSASVLGHDDALSGLRGWPGRGSGP